MDARFGDHSIVINIVSSEREIISHWIIFTLIPYVKTFTQSYFLEGKTRVTNNYVKKH